MSCQSETNDLHLLVVPLSIPGKGLLNLVSLDANWLILPIETGDNHGFTIVKEIIFQP